MSVTIILIVILLILMLVVGGERGLKAFFTLIFNFAILFGIIALMAFEFSPVKVTVFGAIIISSITLFYINGFNKKTIASLISVMIVVLFTLAISYRMAGNANIQGFSQEQAENIRVMSLYVHIDFSELVVCVILIGLLGAIIDVSISISSAMNEIYINNPLITRGRLFESGMNIGKDILGTMTNTMLFAYIGGFMTLLIWFNTLHYSVSQIINAKIFCSEMFPILCSGIGIILIIPITALVASIIIFLNFDRNKVFGNN